MSDQVAGGPLWDHLWDTFHAVRAANRPERGALLDRLCGDDLHLKSEVVQLLAADEATSSPLDRLPVVGLETDEGDAAVALRPGMLLCGRFEILKQIGQGGMGAVYEAADRSLGGRVALKTLLPAIAAEDRARRRFYREIELARQVTHPNVCRLFDLFEHRDNETGELVAFVTMELLQGSTLAERLAQGPLALPEALDVARQVAAALEAAHARGIVHRDLKPGNVMITNDGGVTRVVVTDFGLALRATDAGGDARVTRTGQLLGTPAYMAPEQLLDGEISPATDIYALGLLLCEMITGHQPFESDSPFSAGMKKLRGPVPSPRQFAPAIDDAWERTIVRCLEGEPERRFQSPAAVMASLAGKRPPVWRLLSRRVAVRAFIGAVAVMAAAALLIVVGELRKKPATKPAAVEGLAFRRVVDGDELLGLMGTVSRDGSQMTYVDWSTGDLALRDLQRGTSKRLTDKGPWTRSREYTEYSVLSPDGTRVAYGWASGDAFEVRAIGTDLTRPQVLYRASGLQYAAPFDWTPDGRGVVALLQYPERVRQIVLISSTTGEVTVLKSWSRLSGPTSIGISPDGRFVAYDLIAEDNRDIFVMSVRDRTERRIAQNPAEDRFLEWTPDGKHLVFLSSRGSREGDLGLWSVPLPSEGERAEPRLIRERIGLIAPLGFADDGRFFYGTASRRSDVFETRVPPGSPFAPADAALVEPRLEGRTDAPAYSRDGASLAYLAEGNLEIRTAGEAPRPSKLSMRSFLPFSPPRWWPDGRSLIVAGTDRDGVTGFHRVDAATGSTEPLLRPDYGEQIIHPAISPDGAAVYYLSHGVSDARPWRIVAFDVATKQQRTVYSSPIEDFRRIDLSPDGRSIAFVRQRGRVYTVEVVPAAGGSPRVVYRFEEGIPKVPHVVQWTPDSGSIVVTRNAKELWKADVRTGAAERLATFDAPIRHVAFDRVQGRMAWSLAAARSELWVVENLQAEIGRSLAR